MNPAKAYTWSVSKFTLQVHLTICLPLLDGAWVFSKPYCYKMSTEKVKHTSRDSVMTLYFNQRHTSPYQLWKIQYWSSKANDSKSPKMPVHSICEWIPSCRAGGTVATHFHTFLHAAHPQALSVSRWYIFMSACLCLYAVPHLGCWHAVRWAAVS